MKRKLNFGVVLLFENIAKLLTFRDPAKVLSSCSVYQFQYFRGLCRQTSLEYFSEIEEIYSNIDIVNRNSLNSNSLLLTASRCVKVNLTDIVELNVE